MALIFASSVAVLLVVILSVMTRRSWQWKGSVPSRYKTVENSYAAAPAALAGSLGFLALMGIVAIDGGGRDRASTLGTVAIVLLLVEVFAAICVMRSAQNRRRPWWAIAPALRRREDQSKRSRVRGRSR